MTLCETQILVEIQKPDMKFEYPDEDIRTAVQLSNAHQVRQVIPTSPQEGCSAKRMLGMIDSVEVQGNQLIQQQHTYFSGLILLQS